ncbi:MAG: hypothetical protein Q9195_003693 [Heterodermia aff. obscurata]
MSLNGAFTAVSARQVFARPQPSSPLPSMNQPTTAAADTSQAEKPRREWPEPVRQYVQRAFAQENHLPDVSHQEMETKLKEIIAESASSNTLHVTDWANLPLPQQVIQAGRAASAIPKPMPTNAHWGNAFPSVSTQETNASANGVISKKRKSSEWETSQPAQPPWRNTNDRNVLEDRISYPDKRQRNDSPGKGTSKSQYHLDSRKKRFQDFKSRDILPIQPASAKADTVMDDGPVVGQCQDLEKKYFRLTAAPNPLLVRPLQVLEKTLEYLKKKWRKDGNYSYICDQFKSLRQDLTVQHIKNEFTVSVYEIHARIALEKGDLGGHPTEFKAYRILYLIHTSNRTDMNDMLADLTAAEKKDVAVKHALDARSALALGNFHKFFQLYLGTPNMGAYLMDMFVGRERLAALSNICLSYKMDVKLRFITEELGFESDDESARFICEHGGQAFLEERDDGVRLVTGKASNYFEPAKQAAFRRVDIKGQI